MSRVDVVSNLLSSAELCCWLAQSMMDVSGIWRSSARHLRANETSTSTRASERASEQYRATHGDQRPRAVSAESERPDLFLNKSGERLVVTGATLVVTGALLVVTRS